MSLGFMHPSPRVDVLLVENDVDLLGVFTDILSFAGCTVHGVTTATDAQAFLRHAHVRLLVTDIRLNDRMNGFELADAAQALLPCLPVLFVTGFGSDIVSRQRAARPDAKILLKPFSLDVFVNTARQFLQNDSALIGPSLS